VHNNRATGGTGACVDFSTAQASQVSAVKVRDNNCSGMSQGALNNPTSVSVASYGNQTVSGDTTQSLAGGASVSAAGQIAAPGGLASGSTSAPPATGLIGWYQASAVCSTDGATLATWTDSSSQAANLSGGSAPAICKLNIINGQPVVRWSGATSTMGYQGSNAAFAGSSGITEIVVYRKPVGSVYYTPLVDNAGGNSGPMLRFPTVPTSLLLTSNAGGSPSITGTVVDDGNVHVAAYTLNESSGAAAIYEDGAQIASGTVPTNVPTGLTIGNNGILGMNGSFNGDIAEVLVYRSALTQSQVQSVDTYLASKYGLTLAGSWYVNGTKALLPGVAAPGSCMLPQVVIATTSTGVTCGQPSNTSGAATSLVGSTSAPYPYESATNTTSWYTASQFMTALGLGALATENSVTAGQMPAATSSTQGAVTVPASAALVSTNGSSQFAAATAHAESAIATCTTTNSGNAYTCSTSPSFTPVAGDQVLVNFNASNSAGTASLNVNGSGADTLYKNGGSSSALLTGDLQANHWVRATFDSNAHWQLEGQIGNVNATQVNGATIPASAMLLGTNSSGQTIAASNGTNLTSVYSNATVSYTSVIAFPAAAASATLRGHCMLIWEDSSTSGTVTFAAQASQTPTRLTVMAVPAGSAYVAPTYSTITSTTQTAITGALATGAATTGYGVELEVLLQNGASANTVTIYAASSSTSYTAYVEPGSYCTWLP
jgi:hypothetical protein